MSFFQKLVGEVDDPFAELKTSMAASSADYHAKRLPMVDAAVEFWRDNLGKLADNHAAKLRDIDLLGDNVATEHEQLSKKLYVAHRMLLQQSDANWSESVTNKALSELQHHATMFRLKAKDNG